VRAGLPAQAVARARVGPPVQAVARGPISLQVRDAEPVPAESPARAARGEERPQAEVWHGFPE
jgi:hypothetical protein